MKTFEDLGLATPLLKALAAEGYANPTPIQSQAIPIVLTGRDVVGAAQTGTGKTAAFALPLLQHLAAKPKRPVPRTIRALILAPTRELASQIEESIRVYGRFMKVTSATAFGGVPIGRQRRALAEGLDILVATPGRLLDLVDGRDLTLSAVEVLVLDEADRMLDLGFIHALKRIATLVPAARQSLFFSATMPKPIRELAARFLRDPAEVAVAPVASTAETVDQAVIMTRGERKPALLSHVLGGFLADQPEDRAIVFTRTKHGADKVVKFLARAGIDANAIHGNKSQPQRERALEAFKSGATPILIATDIAARGIDVDGVGLVVNYDLPNIPESYVHRIGRTGRAGATGRAIAFCTPEENAFLADIEKLTRRKVPRMDEPDVIAYAPIPVAQAPAPEAQGQQRKAGRPRDGQRGEAARGDARRQDGGRSQGQGRGQGAARSRTEAARHPEQAARAEGRRDRPSNDRVERSAEAAPRGERPARAERPARTERPRSETPRSEARQGDRRPAPAQGRDEAPVRFTGGADRERPRRETAATDFGDLVRMIAAEEDRSRDKRRSGARR